MVVMLVFAAVSAAVGVKNRRSHTTDGSWVDVAGTAVSVRKVRDTDWPSEFFYTPTIEFVDPMTGDTRQMVGQQRTTPPIVEGDRFVLKFDPSTGEVKHPLYRPVRDQVVPFVLAGVFVVLAVLAVAG